METPREIPLPLFPELAGESRMEHSGVFSPDGKGLYFTISDLRYERFEVLELERRPDGWSAPRVAFFSGADSDHGTSFSPDGKTLYFSSLRPLPGKASGDTWHLWSTRRKEEGWEAPRPVPMAGAEGFWQSHAAVAADGRLYFHRFSGRHAEDFDLFVAEPAEFGYGEPRKLGEAINTGGIEISPFLSPDGRRLFFAAYGRSQGEGDGDLYVSVRRADGGWGLARNLGSPINTAQEESNPTVTPDGRFLVFSRRETASADSSDEPAALRLFWARLGSVRGSR